ncbi:MAG: penicillin-binding protein 2 [Actinobacteria bacterium]|nr:penicillin-binding protein 2 [Actinomycetota bacterium]
MMERQIRRVGIALIALFLAVFVQLNYVQIFAASDIANNGANSRALIKKYSVKRGSIVTIDEVEIARSVATRGKYKYKRTYPEGELFAHITGYLPFAGEATGVEAAFNDDLSGEGGTLSMQDLQDRLLGSGERGDDVMLSIDSRLQEIARDSLGENTGAIVALDPTTGEIRAMYSNPSFDPNPLASFNTGTAEDYYQTLDPDSGTSPLVAVATRRTFPPGSTFKVLTASAALESGRFQPDSTFPDPNELELPLTNQTLTNYSNTACTGSGQIDLFTALRISCDTTFGIIGLRVPDDIREMAGRMGFNESLPLEIGTAVSRFPNIPDDEEPLRAYAGIGQGEVAATTLQMALIAAAVANGGDVPVPRLLHRIIDASAGTVSEPEPETMGEAMSAQNANDVKRMMVAVVESGTGTNARIEGIEVAGKTGTAQSAEGANPHAWFIAFAPANDPQLVVAVFVQNGGSFGAEATGGLVAAPMAKALLEADRRLRDW